MNKKTIQTLDSREKQWLFQSQKNNSTRIIILLILLILYILVHITIHVQNTRVRWCRGGNETVNFDASHTKHNSSPSPPPAHHYDCVVVSPSELKPFRVYNTIYIYIHIYEYDNQLYRVLDFKTRLCKPRQTFQLVSAAAHALPSRHAAQNPLNLPPAPSTTPRRRRNCRGIQYYCVNTCARAQNRIYTRT